MSPNWLSRLAITGARQSMMICAVAISFLGIASAAQAVIDVPEINPGSMGSAAALLTGGVLLLRSRFRS